MKWIKTVLVVVFAVGCTAGAWLFVMDGVPAGGRELNRSFYWIVGDKNILFSEQVLRHIVRTGGPYSVLGIGRDGYVDDERIVYYPRYEPASLYQRLKILAPEINVLGYLRQATDYLARQTGRRVYEQAQFELRHYLVNYDLSPADLPREGYVEQDGAVYPYSSGFLLDWSQTEVKEKYLAAIEAVYNNAGQYADGVMFDAFSRTFTLSPLWRDSYRSRVNQGMISEAEYDQMLLDHRNNAEDFLNQLNYRLSIPAMFGSINYRVTSMASVPQITNDRYNDRPPLFQHAAGVYIEHFGGWTLDDGSFNKIATDANLHKLMSITHDYPQNFFLYMGRNHLNAYVDYEEDYSWYRYIYAQYLLGAKGGNSSFKYWPTGHVEPNPFFGRIFSYETMGDQEVDLGLPLESGWATNSWQVYSRQFQKGVVVLNPHDKGGGTDADWENETGRTLYDIDGEWAGVYSNGVSVTLPNGTAKILLVAAQDMRKERLIDFEQADHWAGYMDKASIREESGNRYLSLARMTDGIHKEHDIALYPVKYRSLTNSAVLKIKVRTPVAEINAQILAMAEVDDTQREHMFAVFEARNFGWNDDSYCLGPDSTPRTTLNKAVFFRARNRYDVPRIPVDSWDGNDWTNLELDAAALLSDPQVMSGGTVNYSGRFTFRRWVFVRFTGGMDVDEIQAGSCTNEVVMIRDRQGL